MFKLIVDKSLTHVQTVQNINPASNYKNTAVKVVFHIDVNLDSGIFL